MEDRGLGQYGGVESHTKVGVARVTEDGGHYEALQLTVDAIMFVPKLCSGASVTENAK